MLSESGDVALEGAAWATYEGAKESFERLKSFGFELIDFLLDAFLEKLKGFEGKIGRGTIVLVEDANEHVDEVDGDANAAALGGGILGIGGG